MRGNGNNSNDRAEARDGYQPEVQKTYTPMAVNGNYQPVVAPWVGTGRQPTPPTGGSGVPSARNNSGAPPKSSQSR